MHKHLNAREWLESLRLTSDCEFIPELIDLLDGIGDRESMAVALEDIHCKAPYLVGGSKLEITDYERISDWVCGRLDLLDSLETIIDEASAGMDLEQHHPAPVDADDKLQAMLDSPRWLDYDL
jgi:hypothetical protein